MAASDIGIDLGTKNCLVATQGKGIILSEPSVVVYDKNTERIRAIGEEARQMSSHLNSNLELIWPIRQGVITDYVVMEKMLKYFIQKAAGHRGIRKPRITVCVPSGVTEIERRAIVEATYQSGARQVFLAKAPIASAIGAGIDILKPFGNMIVDIGAGTTDAAVLSVGGIVIQNTVKVGGDNFNQAIMTYVREKHSLFIGEETAENIKHHIGTVIEDHDGRTYEVKGRNVVTGLPKVAILTADEIHTALKDVAAQVVEAIHGVLEKTSPELAADIVERGIVLTGGGALVGGMDALVEEETGVNTNTLPSALTAAIEGTCRYADVMAKIEAPR